MNKKLKRRPWEAKNYSNFVALMDALLFFAKSLKI